MDPQPSRRPSGESKNSPPMLWFALVVCISLAVSAFLILNPVSIRMNYTDFLGLVQSGRSSLRQPGGSPDPSAERTIVIRTGNNNDRSVEVTAPTDIVVGDRTITGSVRYRYPGEKNEAWQKGRFTVSKLNDSDTNTRLTQILDRSTANWRVGDEPGMWEKVGLPLLIASLVLLLLFLMLRRLGGSSGPMQFSRSRGRLYAEEDLAITFKNVAGIDEAVEEVKEVVDFLQAPEKYQKLGGRIPRGVLLVGPPGTGKTLLAKAIAGEARVPFFSLSGSDFVEMFVGVGAARVRDMFQQAQAKSPCIIFIDELDALGKTRGGGVVGGHDEREQTLNALLVEMDGFESTSNVIVIAATNRPEILDQALLRPGRFDRHVLVDRPDIAGREEILKVHVRNVKLDDTVDLRKIAAISPGFGGAELANLVNEATLLAARKEKTTVGMDEFNEGVERVTAGLEKKNRVMTDEEKMRVAWHESGHALVAYSLPNTDPVHKVSIIPRGLAALGYTMQRPDAERFLMTQSELESQLQVLLAGTMAEEMVYGDISTGASNDLERASDIARGMVMRYGMSRLGRVSYHEDRSSPFLAGAGGDNSGHRFSERIAREIDREVKRIIDEAIERVRYILEARRDVLVALTHRLIEIESVDADELKRIVDDNSKGPFVVPGTALKRRSADVTPRRPALEAPAAIAPPPDDDLHSGAQAN